MCACHPKLVNSSFMLTCHKTRITCVIQCIYKEIATRNVTYFSLFLSLIHLWSCRASICIPLFIPPSDWIAMIVSELRTASMIPISLPVDTQPYGIILTKERLCSLISYEFTSMSVISIYALVREE